MASYCNIGDTARVTFPDGSIRDFTDTPISVSCETIYQECGNATIYFTHSYFNGFSYFYNEEGSARVKLPCTEIRINPDYPNQLEAFCRGKGYTFYPCAPISWVIIGNFSTAYGARYLEVSGINKLVPDNEPERRLIITGYSGATLYDQTVNACDYSVECIEGCPDGSLDCGDCCLPCDTVFNKISDTRKLLKYKKQKQ